MRALIIALLLVCASVAAQDSPPVRDTSPAAAGNGDIESREKAAKLESAKLATAGGWQHLKDGDTTAAIKLFNTAARLNPNDANTYWGLGVATAQQRKFEVALQLLERACALDPNNARLAVDVGLVHTRAAMDDAAEPAARKQKLQASLAWFDKAEALDPSYALIYANRAVALAYLDDYAAATKNIERAETLEKGSVDPKLVAYLAEKSPRPDMAAAANKTAPAPAAVTQAPEQAAPATPVETLPATQPDNGQGEPQKQLRVTSGQPARQKGPDKRQCLDLPTNEAIIRCVYPRR